MNCKELSGSVITIVITILVITVIVMSIITAIQYISWLTSDPVECVDGKLYEVTYEGNIKILDEQYGDICIVNKTK